MGDKLDRSIGWIQLSNVKLVLELRSQPPFLLLSSYGTKYLFWGQISLGSKGCKKVLFRFSVEETYDPLKVSQQEMVLLWVEEIWMIVLDTAELRQNLPESIFTFSKRSLAFHILKGRLRDSSTYWTLVELHPQFSSKTSETVLPF
ncbi:hypothetical protein Tco_0366786 [Tanacetum coccineum]